MTRMTAAQVAVEILKKEGVSHLFGVPGAAINPFYKAVQTQGGLTHTLARHVPEVNGYGVDHVKVAEGLGCKAVRVFEPDQLLPTLKEAQRLRDEFRVPVLVEVILERVTNVSMGTSIANVTEFEELAETGADAPTAAYANPRLRG